MKSLLILGLIVSLSFGDYISFTDNSFENIEIVTEDNNSEEEPDTEKTYEYEESYETGELNWYKAQI